MFTWLQRLFRKKADGVISRYPDGSILSREMTEEESHELFPCNERQLKWIKKHYQCVGNSRKGKSRNHKKKKNTYSGQVIGESNGKRHHTPICGFGCEKCGTFGTNHFIFKVGKEYMCQHCAVRTLDLSHLQ